jgi:flagellar hook assembly protein FlgD
VSGPPEIDPLEIELVNFNKIFDFTSTVNIEESDLILPNDFVLHQSYPNPFNPITTIKFDIPSVRTHGNASVRIYDITGRLIEALIDEELESGNHTIQWNATGFSSGVYFVRLQSDNYGQTQKLILMK